MMKNNKIFRFWTLGVVVALLLTACAAPAVSTAAAEKPAEVKPVKIAHIAGFTGSFATYSAMEKNAAIMMEDVINKAGGIKSLGGAPIKFVFADHMSDAAQVTTVFERTVEDPDIVAVLHNNSSTFTLPMLASMEKVGIPLFTINSAAKITNQGYTFVFQSVFLASEVGKAQVEFIKYMKDTYGLNTSKVGIIFQDNDPGRDGAEASKKLAVDNGLTVVAFEAFPIGSADMSPQVVKLMNSGAEIVLLTGDINDCKQVLSTMKTYNYKPLVIGGGAGFMIQEFAKALGDNAIGVTTVATYAFDAKHVKENAQLNGLVNEFFTRYGVYPSSYEMGLMSETLSVVAALEKSGSRDRTVLRDTLKAMEHTTFAIGSPMKYSAEGASPNMIAAVDQWQKLSNGVYALVGVWPVKYMTSKFDASAIGK